VQLHQAVNNEMDYGMQSASCLVFGDRLKGVPAVSKRLCSIVFLYLVMMNVAVSMDLSGQGGLEQQLLLLGRISYHPSLLPLIMQNIDYLELTPDQQHKLREWRTRSAPAMLDKMREVAQGRIEFIDLTMNPATAAEVLVAQQQRLFRLQEEVLSYKLSCRQNILETFTAEQWETLQLLLAERQLETLE
jgi:hypothetical protein